MKSNYHILFIVTFFLMGTFFYKRVFGQNEAASNLKTVEHHSFKAGEFLEYRIHYGLINAGKATLQVKKVEKKLAGREIYRVIGEGRSRGAFDWFFKVRDRYESYMDVAGVFPWLFLRDVNEGGYKIKQKYKFSPTKQEVTNDKGETFATKEGIQDMLSSFYYARTIDYSSAEQGDVFTIWSFVDNEVWPLKIKYMGKDQIKVSGDRYKALKFHPVIQTGRLFEKEEDVTVWISDDENKIPLLAQGKVLVGSVKMELTKAEGLANPSSKIK